MTIPPTNNDLLDRDARAYLRAFHHLEARGLCTAPRQPEMQKLWASGPTGRAVVDRITRHWNGYFQ